MEKRQRVQKTSKVAKKINPGNRSIDKKEAILQAAMERFLEKGYSATSTNDICAAAGINKPTLYYYFESKRHLFFEAHIKHIQEVLKPYMERAASIADPSERLAFMIREFTKIVCHQPELRVLTHEAMSIRDQYFEEIRKEWKKHYLLLLNTIKELQSQGVIAADLKPSWVALLLLGMITWITYWFDHHRTEHIDDIAETALKVTLCGLLEKEGALSMRKEAG
jgi:AcrR family transcriptional regulator